MTRQKRLGYFFGFLAVMGLAMYLFLPAGSELRLLGIVLMIFCLPISIRYGFRQARAQTRTPAPAPAAEPASVFREREVNLTLEATFSQIVATSLMRVDNDILDLPCLLAQGSDGFRTRLWRADKIGGPWPNNEPLILHAEFLMPERAMSRFPVNALARVVVGTSDLGVVKVIRNHAQDSPEPANPGQ